MLLRATSFISGDLVPSSIKAERLNQVHFLHCHHCRVLPVLPHNIPPPQTQQGVDFHCLCFGNGRNGCSEHVSGLCKSIWSASDQSQSDYITVHSTMLAFSPSSVLQCSTGLSDRSGSNIHFANNQVSKDMALC